MKTCEAILDFMRNVEGRLHAIVKWQEFKIVVNPKTFENMCRETQFYFNTFAQDGDPCLYGCKLEVDADARHDFEFVSGHMRIAPPHTEDEVSNVRICHLGDIELAVSKAKDAYYDVFFGDSYDVGQLAVELKKMAKNYNCKLAPCERGLVMFASYLIAKQAGFMAGPRAEDKAVQE